MGPDQSRDRVGLVEMIVDGEINGHCQQRCGGEEEMVATEDVAAQRQR